MLQDKPDKKDEEDRKSLEEFKIGEPYPDPEVERLKEFKMRIKTFSFVAKMLRTVSKSKTLEEFVEKAETLKYVGTEVLEWCEENKGKDTDKKERPIGFRPK